MTQTHDMPMAIGDGANVLINLPAGTVPRGVPVDQLELRAGPDGEVQICRKAATTDSAGRPTRAALEDQNAQGLRRVFEAGGGVRAR